MDVIPISSLVPATPIPSNTGFKALVTLLWPFSSSTGQCALLLADPDFRKRYQRGQVRVRFSGPSARLIGTSKISIGDEIVLCLDGARWVDESVDGGLVRTPGKGVEGELVFKSRLKLAVRKEGQEEHTTLEVDEQDQPSTQRASNDALPSTPIPRPSRRSGFGIDDFSAAVYSSPAFMKRLRLSEGSFGHSPYTPVSEDDDLDTETSRKRRRVSYKNVTEWRFDTREPSPEKNDGEGHATAMEDVSQTIVPESSQAKVSGMDASGPQVPEVSTTGKENQETAESSERLTEAEHTKAPDSMETLEDPVTEEVETSSGEQRGDAEKGALKTAVMAPPPLPQLRMPETFPQVQSEDISASRHDNAQVPRAEPLTPRLEPVGNQNLPLPSPFPTSATQEYFPSSIASTVTDVHETENTATRPQPEANTKRSEENAEKTEQTIRTASELEAMESPSRSGSTTKGIQITEMGQSEPDDENVERVLGVLERSTTPHSKTSGSPPEGMSVTEVREETEAKTPPTSDVTSKPATTAEDVVEQVVTPKAQQRVIFDTFRGMGHVPSPPVVVHTEQDQPPAEANDESPVQAEASVPDEALVQEEARVQEQEAVQEESAVQDEATVQEDTTVSEEVAMQDGPSAFDTDIEEVHSPSRGSEADVSSENGYDEDVLASLQASEVSDEEETPDWDMLTKDLRDEIDEQDLKALMDEATDSDDDKLVHDDDDDELEELEEAMLERSDDQSEEEDDQSREEDAEIEAWDEESAASDEQDQSSLRLASQIQPMMIDEQENEPSGSNGIGLSRADRGEIVPSSAPALQSNEDVPAEEEAAWEARDAALRAMAEDQPPVVASVSTMPLSSIVRAETLPDAPPDASRSKVSVVEILSDSDDDDEEAEEEEEADAEEEEEEDEVEVEEDEVEENVEEDEVEEDEVEEDEVEEEEIEEDEVEEDEHGVEDSNETRHTKDGIERTKGDTASDGLHVEGIGPESAKNAAHISEASVPASVHPRDDMDDQFLNRSPSRSDLENALQHFGDREMDDELPLQTRDSEPASDDTATSVHTNGGVHDNSQHADGLKRSLPGRSEPTMETSVDVGSPALSLPGIDTVATVPEPASQSTHQDLDHAQQLTGSSFMTLSSSSSPAQLPVDAYKGTVEEIDLSQIEPDFLVSTNLSQRKGTQRTEPVPDSVGSPATTLLPGSSRVNSRTVTPFHANAVAHQLDEPMERNRAPLLSQDLGLSQLLQERPGQSVETVTPQDSLQVANANEYLQHSASRTQGLSSAELAIEASIDDELLKDHIGEVASTSNDSESNLGQSSEIARLQMSRDGNGDIVTQATSVHSVLPNETVTMLEQVDKVLPQVLDGRHPLAATPSESEENEEVPQSQQQQQQHLTQLVLPQPDKSEESVPKDPQTPAPTRPRTSSLRKSLAGNMSGVPKVISAWFTPRRSSGLLSPAQREKIAEPETPARAATAAGANVVAERKQQKSVSPPPLGRSASQGISTSLSYFHPLATVQDYLNQPATTVDIVAVSTGESAQAAKAKSGPRDFFTILYLVDPSLDEQNQSGVAKDMRAEIFRPWKASLPTADAGDVVLLRNFVVKSQKHRTYLLSSDASSWCVWRFSTTGPREQDEQDMFKPMWARKQQHTVKEEMKGPPMDVGLEEREKVKELRKWWEALQASNTERAEQSFDGDASEQEGQSAEVEHNEE